VDAVGKPTDAVNRVHAIDYDAQRCQGRLGCKLRHDESAIRADLKSLQVWPPPCDVNYITSSGVGLEVRPPDGKGE